MTAAVYSHCKAVNTDGGEPYAWWAYKWYCQIHHQRQDPFVFYKTMANKSTLVKFVITFEGTANVTHKYVQLMQPHLADLIVKWLFKIQDICKICGALNFNHKLKKCTRPFVSD